jgi:methionyl-tRNA formyltransferase
MLVSAICDGLHVPPLKDVGWRSEARNLPLPRDAPKLKTEDREVDWAAPGWSAADFELHSRVLGPPWALALQSTGDLRRVILEGVEEVEAPEEVAVFMREVRKKVQDLLPETSNDIAPVEGETESQQIGKNTPTVDEFGAVVDDGTAPKVKTVTWIQQVEETPDMPNHRKNWHELRLPYFVDGEAIIIPAIGGGCVRIAKLKLEGEKSKAAAVAVESLTEWRIQQDRGPIDYLADVLVLPQVSDAGGAFWLHVFDDVL